MLSHNIHLKRPRSDDPYLEYESIGQYYHKMGSYVIPFDHLQLVKHMHHFTKFINTLYQDEHVKKKLVSSKKLINRQVQYEKEEEEGDDRLWFLKIDKDGIKQEDDEEEEEESMNIESTINYGNICSTAWEWHNTIKSRVSPFTSNYAISYFLSWGSFCRSYYLNKMIRTSNKDPWITRKATDYSFTSMVNSSYYIIICDKIIMKYSLTELFNAIKILLPVLYTFTYTQDMKDYVYHLFLRYCHILTIVCDRDEEDDLLDNPTLYTYHDEDEDDDETSKTIDYEEEEDFNAFKSKSIRMGLNYSITSNYIYEGEILFQHQLHRLTLSSKLTQMSIESPLLFDKDYSTDQERFILIKLCLDQWKKVIDDLSVHKHIGSTVKEDFHKDAMHLFLYHGEKERYIRNWTESNSSPGDIISQTRPDDFTSLQRVRKIVIKEIANQYKKSFMEFLNNKTKLNNKLSDGQGYESRSISSSSSSSKAFNLSFLVNNTNHSNSIHHHNDLSSNDSSLTMMMIPYIDVEKECILATKVCTINWLKYNRELVEDWRLIEASFIIEELCDTMTPIDDIFMEHHTRQLRPDLNQKQKHPPSLVRLMRLYYVIDINHPQIKTYKTDVFPKAYFLWLTLLRKYNLVKEKALHKDTINIVHMMLNKLNK